MTELKAGCSIISAAVSDISRFERYHRKVLLGFDV